MAAIAGTVSVIILLNNHPNNKTKRGVVVQYEAQKELTGMDRINRMKKKQ